MDAFEANTESDSDTNAVAVPVETNGIDPNASLRSGVCLTGRPSTKMITKVTENEMTHHAVIMHS